MSQGGKASGRAVGEEGIANGISRLRGVASHATHRKSTHLALEATRDSVGQTDDVTQSNASWREWEGAIGGGSAESFRWRRIFQKCTEDTTADYSGP